MTWSKQITHFQRLVGRDTDEDRATYIASKRALHERGAWQAIDNVIADALRGFLAFGPEYARRAYGPLHEFAAPAVAAYVETTEGDGPLSTMPFELADSTSFFEILGYAIPSEALASLAPLLSRIVTSRKDREYVHWHWQRGFIALALRVEPVWRGIAGLLPGPLSFSPGEAFGPNVQGLLAYLASALQNRAELVDVMSAWKTFLAITPALAVAKQSSFQNLFWVARLVYHDIGGEPLGRVGERLYADVQELAAAGF
jgi:hypothetical protein